MKKIKHIIFIAYELNFKLLYLLNSPDGSRNTFWLRYIVFSKAFQKDWSGQQEQNPTMSTETALLNNLKGRIFNQEPSLLRMTAST